MIGRKISHYKVLEEIGSGGMGIVYKAEDTKLNRTVALKFVVPRIIRREEDRKRFVREAQTAASLNHPNICTIFEIDEEGENLFIAMEYVEGESLKDIIQKGPLKMESVLDIALQIADGLKEAHEEGVVHRDIKSSNILLTKKGQAKIMDFGLAKPLKEADITETATIMGTVAYMSPEQASGEAFDHRTDIWSFGVVLYEMLSGQLPFGGEHQQLILYSILHKNPQPIANMPYPVPIDLERIIQKCLEKDPSERYQRADELAEDLRILKKETETGVVPSRKKLRVKARRVSPITTIALGVLLCVILVLISGYFVFNWFGSPEKYKTSIAVLPFEDIDPHQDSEPFCRSVTEALIDKFALICNEWRVVPYESVAKYRDLDLDSRVFKRELDVEYILSSTFQRQGEQVLINIRLIDTRENAIIKPYHYESEEKKLFTLYDGFSRELIEDLGLSFEESGLILAKKEEPTDFKAYEYYKKGMILVDESDRYSDPEEWFSEALNKFYQALSIDPNYARAYWGIGAAHEAYYVSKKKKENLQLMLEYLEKAYNLNPELAETNISLGWAYFYREDMDNAHKSFKKALEIASDNPMVLCQGFSNVGAFLASIGLYAQAIKYCSKAIEIEPTYLRAYLNQAICQWYIGEYDACEKTLQMRFQIEREYLNLRDIYARLLIMTDRYDEANRELIEIERSNPDYISSLKEIKALLLAKKGEKEKALELIQDSEKFTFVVTCIYALLGMKKEAIENIEIGIEVGLEKEQQYLYSYPILHMNPCYESLRDDSRFIRIMQREKQVYENRLRKYGKF